MKVTVNEIKRSPMKIGERFFCDGTLIAIFFGNFRIRI